jgi:hypothetical protein
MSDPYPDTPIAELFARNPGDLGEQDINAIIEKLRSQRHRFLAGDKTAGSPRPSKTTQKQEAAQKVTGAIDLDGLGI